MKYCEKCGEQLLDEAVMCPKCKHMIVKTADKKQNELNANTRMLCLLGAAAIIIIFIIAVCSQI